MKFFGFGRSIKDTFRYTLAKIPASTELYQILRWNEEIQTFDLRNYSEIKSQNMFKVSELYYVMDEIHENCEITPVKFYTELRSYINSVILTCLWLVLISSGYITRALELEYSAFNITFVQGCLASLTISVYVLLQFIVQKKFENMLKKRKTDFSEILSKLNRERFSERKIMINVGKYGTYLEVHLLFLKDQILTSKRNSAKSSPRKTSDKVMISKVRSKIDMAGIESITEEELSDAKNSKLLLIEK